MDNELQLISDGDGLAVIGEPQAVERFLTSEGLASRELGLNRLQKFAAAGAAAMQGGSQIAENSGRWVKLTKESADVVRKQGLMPTGTPGVSYAMIGKPGDIQKWIKIAKAPGSLPSPAVLSGAAGIMAQLAMQQAMDEITDYLAKIDQKLDDVLRAQRDAVLADMIGVDLVIDEAMTVREHVGRVSDVTWSKVQPTSMTIARTQAYALRQLDALTDRVDCKAKIGDLADTSTEARTKVQEWLAVLARCFQLQDAIAVLELDRVLDTAPDELDQHRSALRAARQQRMDLICRSSGRLMARLDEAANRANSKVLLHPTKAPVVVSASNHVATSVHELDEGLGIERGRGHVALRRWVDAAGDLRDKAVGAGADGVDAAKRRGIETLVRARSVKNTFTTGVSENVRRRRDKTDKNREHSTEDV